MCRVNCFLDFPEEIVRENLLLLFVYVLFILKEYFVRFCLFHTSYWNKTICIALVQTIKNEDLEEIRELGSGTYGSVFHGKWKGSDVAIKRIKASCFAGRPSDRERLVCP